MVIFSQEGFFSLCREEDLVRMRMGENKRESKVEGGGTVSSAVESLLLY